MGNLFDELKRRNVIRVGAAYLVIGWVVMQVIDVIVEPLRLPEWTATLVIVLLMIGLPITLFLAWAFEHTPEGVKRTEDVDLEDSVAPNTGKKLNYVIIGTLVLALGYFVWERQGLIEQTEGLVEQAEISAAAPTVADAVANMSVAVLPFVDMSPEADQGWFADGLTEEILNSLTRLPELTVTARTSSFYFKGQNLPIQEIAEKLGVAHVVEGSVRQAGNQLRITAQLIRASDGFHLWSDTYDRSIEDVFAVQEDVAENVARALDIVLDTEKRERMFSSGTRSVEAYEAFLRGRAIFEAAHDGVDGASLWEANSYFEKAIAADSKYYLPHYYHRDANIHFVKEGPEGPYLAGVYVPDLTPNAAHQRYLADMEQAIKYAPSEHQRILFEIERTQLSDDWRQLPGLIRRLEALDLSMDVYATGGGWVTNILFTLDRADLVVRLAEEQLKRNPMNPFVWAEFINALLHHGRYDEAAAQLAVAREKGVRHAFIDDAELSLYLATDNNEALEAVLDRYAPESSTDRGLFLAALGRRQEANEIIAKIDPDDPYSEIMIGAHMYLGDMEAAEELAARIDASPLGNLKLQDALFYTNFRFPFRLETTPNFRARLLEAGLTDAEIEARIHPVVKAVGKP